MKQLPLVPALLGCLLLTTYAQAQEPTIIEAWGTFVRTNHTIRHLYQKFSADGLLLEEFFLHDYKDTLIKSAYTYTYDNEKKLVLKQGYDKKPENKVRISYMTEPKLAIVLEIRNNDTLSHYTYWGKGNRKPLIILEKRTNHKGRTIEKVEYSYSPKDSLILETTTQRINNKLKTKKNIHQYNTQTFQKTEIRSFDFQNHLANQVVFKYDTQARLTELKDYQHLCTYQYREATTELAVATYHYLKENRKQIWQYAQGKPKQIQYFEGNTLIYTLNYR